MSRRLLLPALLLALFVTPRTARAEEDPVFRGKKVSEWVVELKEGKSVNRRRVALLAVEYIGPKRSRKVFPALVGALRGDPDRRIREAAAKSLGRAIAKLLSDPDRDEPLRLDTVRDGLVGALRKDKEARVREAAAAALGKMEKEGRSAVPTLAEALADKDPGTRTAAADALRQIGKDAAEALPALQKALADKDAPRLMRVQAALAIGRIGAPDAQPVVPVLGKLVADAGTPLEVRKAAAESLGLLGRDAGEAAANLAVALADADTELRRAAAAALDQIGPPARAALPSLRKAIEDKDKFVRTVALHAIGRIKNLGEERKAIVTAILACLNDSVIEVRVAAIETFGALGAEGLGPDTKAVIDRLTEVSRDSQQDIRDAARNALKKIK